MPSASRATSLRRFHPCGSSRSRARPRDVLADDPERREAMTRRKVAGVLLVFIAAIGQQVLGGASPAKGRESNGVPKFEVDPSWPQKLPNNWVLGTSINVSIDRRDHVGIIHRYRLVPAELRDRAAPPVLEFDENGKFLQAWGGPSDAYEWPDLEHSITVDYKDNVWIAGSNPVFPSGSKRSDDMLLKFTKRGKIISQFGRRDQSGGTK